MCYMKPDYGPFDDPLKGIPRNPYQQPTRDFPKNVPWRLNPNEKKWPPTHPSPLDNLPDEFFKLITLPEYINCSIEEATALKNLKTNKAYIKSEPIKYTNTFKLVKNEVWVSEGTTLIYVIAISDIKNSAYQPLKDRLKDVNLEGKITHVDYDSKTVTTKIIITVVGNLITLGLSGKEVKITSIK